MLLRRTLHSAKKKTTQTVWVSSIGEKCNHLPQQLHWVYVSWGILLSMALLLHFLDAVRQTASRTPQLKVQFL